MLRRKGRSRGKSLVKGGNPSESDCSFSSEQRSSNTQIFIHSFNEYSKYVLCVEH